MSALQILTRALGLGILILIVPLGTFAAESGSSGKFHALLTLLTSLIGLAIISCILWIGHLIRRREQMEQIRISRNDEFLVHLLNKKRGQIELAKIHAPPGEKFR